MTVLYLTCDSCCTMQNYTDMVMCPLCRKTLCKRCVVPGGAQAGFCANKNPCEGKPAHPNANKEVRKDPSGVR